MWDGECKEAFRKLKEICTSTPILAYAMFLKLFKLHTDACTLGLGAILHQNQDGVDGVIGYASRAPSKTEHKYPGHKWVIMKQFHEYLYGNTFVIYTDNNPHTHILTSVKFDATGHYCWVASLANNNSALSYQLGKVDVDAYVLSHIAREEHDQHIEADLVYDCPHM